MTDEMFQIEIPMADLDRWVLRIAEASDDAAIDKLYEQIDALFTGFGNATVHMVIATFLARLIELLDVPGLITVAIVGRIAMQLAEAAQRREDDA